MRNAGERRKQRKYQINSALSHAPTNLHIAYACSPFFHFSFPLGWRSVGSAQGCKHSINRERKWKRERELTCKREARQLRVPQRWMLLPRVMCRSRPLSPRNRNRSPWLHMIRRLRQTSPACLGYPRRDRRRKKPQLLSCRFPPLLSYS